MFNLNPQVQPITEITIVPLFILVIDGCDFLDDAFYILQNIIYVIIMYNMNVEWFIAVFHIDKSL